MNRAIVWTGVLALVAFAAYFGMRAPRGERASAERVVAEGVGSRAAELVAGAESSSELEERRAEVEAAPTEPADAHAVAAPVVRGGIDVRVVDTRGAPVGGQEVALVTAVLHAQQGGPRAVTDAEGRARLASEPRPFGMESAAVAAVGPFAPAHARRVDLGALPREPVELVLDVGGALQIVVVEADGTLVDGASVQVVPLVVADDMNVLQGLHAARVTMTTTAGVARIERVQAGLALRVALERPDLRAPPSEVIVGPPRGETARVTFVQPPPSATLTGRVVERDIGGAWMWSVLRFVENGVGYLTGGALLTDDDGAFRVAIGHVDVQRLGADTRLVVMAAGRPAAWFPLGDLAPGATLDLGAIAPPDASVIAAGRVRTERGDPLAGVDVDVEARLGSGAWGQLPYATASTSGPDGAFELPGVADPSLAWRVAVADRAYERIAPDVVALGARDVDLVLRQHAVIAGKLLLDTRADGEGLARRLDLRVEPGGRDGRPWPIVRRSNDPPGTFEIVRACPGDALLVDPDWHDRPIVRIDDLGPALEAGELTIDLRGRLSVARVSAVGPDGARLDFLPRPRGAPPRSLPFGEREWTLVLDAPELPIVATAAGYRDVDAIAREGELELHFEARELPIRLTWSAMPALTAEQRVRAVLVPADLEDATGLDLANLDAHGAFDPEGVARLGARATGLHRVVLQCEIRRQGGVTTAIVANASPPIIHVRDVADEQTFAVDFAPEPVREQLAGMAW